MAKSLTIEALFKDLIKLLVLAVTVNFCVGELIK